MAKTGSRTAEAAVCVVWEAPGRTLRLVTKGLEALVGRRRVGLHPCHRRGTHARRPGSGSARTSLRSQVRPMDARTHLTRAPTLA